MSNHKSLEDTQIEDWFDNQGVMQILHISSRTLQNLRSNGSLLQIYNVITGNYYKSRTEHLRSITDPAQARKFKAANFDYCTFSGIFTTRSDKELIKHSDLLCIDFDHLPNLSEIRNRLLADEYFETQLLFTSPSGDGLLIRQSHGNYAKKSEV